MKETVRILLIGDDGVGKSSLMSSYISNHFPQEVPHVMTEAVLPPETTANNTCVIIMDSSARPGDREVLNHKISVADCIIAVYDTSKPATLDNLSSNWLPLVSEINKDAEPKHCIVVGTKADLSTDYDDDRDKLHSLLLTFPFVEMSLRCSAAKLLDVDSVFYFGEMVVSFPLGPIFDVHTHDFTPACRRALLRIFRVFDADNDNLLSDAELSECNVKCFDVSFNAEDMTKLKKQVSATISDGIENNHVTFEGFLDIIKAMIDNHQFQVPWAMLLRCDFNEDLQLLIPEEVKATPGRQPHQISELSGQARNFLFNLAQIAQNECEKEIMENSSAAAVAVGQGVPMLSNPRDRGGDLDRAFEDNSSSASNTTSIFGFDARIYGLTWESLKYIMSVIDPDAENPWLDPPLYKKLTMYDPYGNELRVGGVPATGGIAGMSMVSSFIESSSSLASGARMAEQPQIEQSGGGDGRVGSLSPSSALAAIASSNKPHTDSTFLSSSALQMSHGPADSHSPHWTTSASSMMADTQQCLVLSGLPHIGANLSFDSWLTQWHIMAAVDPKLCQCLLFRLGYAEREDLGTIVSSPPLNRTEAASVSGNAVNESAYAQRGFTEVDLHDSSSRNSFFGMLSSTISLMGPSRLHLPQLLPRSTLKICVLGDNSVGKSSFVWNISGVPAPGIPDVEKGVKNSKSQDAIVIGGVCVPVRGALPLSIASLNTVPGAVISSNRRYSDGPEIGRRGTESILGADSTVDDLSQVCYFCVSAIPRDQTAAWLAAHGPSCDIALLMFDCGSEESFNTALSIEETLPFGMPRLFVGSKADLGDDISTAAASATAAVAEKYQDQSPAAHSKLSVAVQSAAFHVQRQDILPVLQTSIVTGDGIRDVLCAVRDVALDPLKAVPSLQRPQAPVAAGFPSFFRVGCFAASFVGALYLLNARFGMAAVFSQADVIQKARKWLVQTFRPIFRSIPFLATFLGIRGSNGSTKGSSIRD